MASRVDDKASPYRTPESELRISSKRRAACAGSSSVSVKLIPFSEGGPDSSWPASVSPSITKRNIDFPTPISSPLRSGWSCSGRPLTYVPLALPRSVMVNCRPFRVKRQCSLDTERSSMHRAFSTERPMEKDSPSAWVRGKTPPRSGPTMDTSLSCMPEKFATFSIQHPIWRAALRHSSPSRCRFELGAGWKLPDPLGAATLRDKPLRLQEETIRLAVRDCGPGSPVNEAPSTVRNTNSVR